jgi:hypothetical protein
VYGPTCTSSGGRLAVGALDRAGQVSRAMQERMQHNSVATTTSAPPADSPLGLQAVMPRMINGLRRLTGITQKPTAAEFELTFPTISP